MQSQIARGDTQCKKLIQILINYPMQTTHELIIMVVIREKAPIVRSRSRAAHSIPPLHLHLHTILLLFYLIHADSKCT
jgi:hypothetical protein